MDFLFTFKLLFTDMQVAVLITKQLAMSAEQLASLQYVRCL